MSWGAFFGSRLILKPSGAALGQPLLQRLPGLGQLKSAKTCHCSGERLRHGGVHFAMVSTHINSYREFNRFWDHFFG